MATPTIPNGEEYFFPIIYEGNGAGQRVGKFVPFTDNGTIDNSCIFNSADNANLSRTPSGAGNRKTFTISFWIKRAKLNTTNGQQILTSHTDTSNRFQMFFDASVGGGAVGNKLTCFDISGGTVINLFETNRTFEDTSKFYHILLAFDTTQSTASDRMKLYIDGDQVTSFNVVNYPAQDYQLRWNINATHYIGRYGASTAYPLDAYLAEFNNVDGQALLPASFGETDTSTGRWVPSTVKPYPTTTTTFTVTVSNPGSGNKYYIDSSQQATVTLIEGATYRFDQSDSSNSGHPLRFSTTSDGTHGGGTEFTSGVTTVGTPGSSGAYTEITVPTGTATLYYYCSVHSGMGGTANTQDQYGVNGFRLKFQDSSSLGDDTSGNTNDFTATNLASTDQTTDSPSQNFATLKNNTVADGNLSEGNLRFVGNTSSYFQKVATLRPTSGKYYAEFTINSSGGGIIAVTDANVVQTSASTYVPFGYGYGWYQANGNIYDEDVNVVTSGSTYTTSDVLAIALDLDNQEVKFYKNNVLDNTIGLNGTHVAMAVGNYSQPLSCDITANFGQKSFTYTPPTGFVALQQDNLPETAKGVSGLVWTKNRDAADSHQLYDSSRGKQLALASNAKNEATVTDGLQKFLAGGQQIEDDVSINTSGESFVTWNWVGNGGSTSSNTEGSITSTVQANTTAGFSIVQYTGTGSTATVGHGLSQAPEWFIIKSLSLTTNWYVYHKSMGATYQMYLNLTNAQDTSVLTAWNDTAPTSSVISLPPTGYGSNNASATYLIYAWHGVDGFSKFGSYTGNGSTDGPFVYTGFKPAWIMIKQTNSTGSWIISDNKRNIFNPIDKLLRGEGTNTESTFTSYDMLSNGFKQRNTDTGFNGSGSTYIYMAVAEHPFVGDGTNPVTAR
jgi:hypothetical protein